MFSHYHIIPLNKPCTNGADIMWILDELQLQLLASRHFIFILHANMQAGHAQNFSTLQGPYYLQYRIDMYIIISIFLFWCCVEYHYGAFMRLLFGLLQKASLEMR